jgi:hypothetical protein
VPRLHPRARPPKARKPINLGWTVGLVKVHAVQPCLPEGATLHGQGQQLAAPGLRGWHAGRPSSPMPSPSPTQSAKDGLQEHHDFVVGREHHRQSSRDKRWGSAAGSNPRRHSKATGRAALPTVVQKTWCWDMPFLPFQRASEKSTWMIKVVLLVQTGVHIWSELGHPGTRQYRRSDERTAWTAMVSERVRKVGRLPGPFPAKNVRAPECCCS